MSDVQQRHDQIRQLETSMLELHQVFLDMSILVADQGETINNIDNWVSSSARTASDPISAKILKLHLAGLELLCSATSNPHISTDLQT